MFKKKEGEVKPKVSGKRKIIVFAMLGLFVLGSYLNQDGDGYNYRIDGSDAQKFMIELADETRRSFSSGDTDACLLYTSPSPRDVEESRMPSSA